MNGSHVTLYGQTLKRNLRLFALGTWITLTFYLSVWTRHPKNIPYAEYAIRTLLFLKVVKGWCEELRTLIVIRNIEIHQIKATAANANLTAGDLVSLLWIYTKPSRTENTKSRPQAKPQITWRSGSMCYYCRQRGYSERNCHKNKQINPHNNPNTSCTPVVRSTMTCAFYKKTGHSEDTRYVKNRSGLRNQQNVNLRSPKMVANTDVIPAVVQGIPMDILIEGGPHNISLISSDVL